ncbi:MAG TPA: M14 family zinc carboxypeptidase [Acidimicrobiales bacterium]|nr:M14 family zinc carboxypeptidase [Acidimicrobiales bacterium]
MGRTSRMAAAAVACIVIVASGATPAMATPVCTDGYMGGPPRDLCGGRIFPEAARASAYTQLSPDPTGFKEFQHGIEYLAQQYPRWVTVFTLRSHFKDDRAVSSSDDRTRADEPGDTKDGRDVWVIKLTDSRVPDKGKDTLFFSLSVHGNERGGLEGGLRTAEDLAVAAEEGGRVVDGIANYETTTGKAPTFHSYQVRDLLRKEVVYLSAFNADGWAVGDLFYAGGTRPYERENSMGTDLNRQMPTVGWIDPSRNPLAEGETRYGLKFMREVAAQGRNGQMAIGSDVHGELNSNAYVDIMYPGGQFDSVQHRRMMSTAERVKSVVDATLYEGIIDQVEAATGGNSEQGVPGEAIPTKPARWQTAYDLLGYTDTGYIGDYQATDLAFTGLDYEIFLNHTVPDKVWDRYLQENHINATRAIVKTSMAYAQTQGQEFNDDNVKIETLGRPGYVLNPDPVTDTDANGPGHLPGPDGDGKGENGKPVVQAHYSATNMRWFQRASRFLQQPFVPVMSADIASGTDVLDAVDTLVLADIAVPRDPKGRPVDEASYYRNIRAWVNRGGNLVLTDRAVHALSSIGVVPDEGIDDIVTYQPFTDVQNFAHPMVEGLRPNAHQLVETPPLGFQILSDESPMTVVDAAAITAAKGQVVGTSGAGLASVAEIPVGQGQVRIVGAALPMPTEENDHRYGLRDYALTYTGLYILENSLRHDAPGLGGSPPANQGDTRGPGAAEPGQLPATGGDAATPVIAALLLVAAGAIRRRASRPARATAS